MKFIVTVLAIPFCAAIYFGSPDYIPPFGAYGYRGFGPSSGGYSMSYRRSSSSTSNRSNSGSRLDSGDAEKTYY